MNVIHFFDLDHFVDEVQEGTIVRLEAIFVGVQSQDVAGLGREKAEIHIRSISGASILCCMIPVGSIQTLHGEPFGHDPDAPGELERRAKRARAAIQEYLKQVGLDVRPGLIDIGDAKPVSGRWAGLADTVEVDHA